MRLKLYSVVMLIFSGVILSCAHRNSNDYALYDKDGKIVGGNPNFKSLVDREGVRDSVKLSAAELKECYLQELKKSAEAAGKLIMRFEVKTDVISLIDVHSNAGNFSDSMIDCVKKVLMNKKYPQAPANSFYEVIYPFNFGKQGN